MSGLDFVVAGRMHACIGALSAGVPMVPIAYSRKFAGLFGSLGYSWLVPVTGMNADQAAAYVLDCISRREELADDAAKSMARVSSLLDAYRAELRSLFEAVVR
jgi:polysaccharide pyruvyl transferase WcaK-like protein